MSAAIEASDSQFKTFQGCPRKWAYTKHLGLESDENKDNMHLGNAAHDGMEEYIKTRDMTKAIQCALTAIGRDKPTNSEYQKMLVPAMLIGWATHWLPSFEREYTYIALEEWFTSEPNPDVIRIRGYKDVVAVKKQTGARCVFDYKTSSDSYCRELIATLSSNNQLARYATAERRQTGAWPAEVGLVFLLKPKAKDPLVAVENARCDPSLYRMVIQQVTPQFAQFAISVEQNDTLMGQQMQFYRDLIAQHGPEACDHIPANLGNCYKYGSMCGFAQGCHSGIPAHRSLPKKG